jgi:hypothetical protein
MKLKYLITAENKFLSIGLVGVFATVFSGLILWATTQPFTLRSDSVLHLDYAWQVSQRELPDFWEGTQLPTKSASKVQYVSQHPPLYYLLLAPLVNKPIDNGRLDIAMAIGRMFTICVSLLVTAALVWAGWVFGGEKKSLFAIALPAIVTSTLVFVRAAAEVKNDILALLFTTIALVLFALIIKKGMNTKRFVALVLVCSAGMASRATFISVIVLVPISFGAAVLYNEKIDLKIKLLKSILLSALLMIVVLTSIGWFYYNNYMLSGSWHRTAPQSWAADILGREYRTLNDILTNYRLWLSLPGGLYGNNINIILSYSVFITGFFLATLFCLKTQCLRLLKEKKILFITIIMLLHSSLTFFEQIAHATGYGSINPRYLLPMLIPVGLVLCYGFLGWEKTRGQLITLFTASGWLAAGASSAAIIKTKTNITGSNTLQILNESAVKTNGLPDFILPLLIVVLSCGLVMIAIALWKLNHKLNITT